MDDIIVGSTSDNLSLWFAHTMKSKFEMSMEGELKFFLSLQIRQAKDGIFVSQTKFAKDLVSKFGLLESEPAKTPMSTSIKLTSNVNGVDVDTKLYRSMIGSLLYLTAS